MNSIYAQETPFEIHSDTDDFELGPAPPVHMTPKLARQVAMDCKLTSRCMTLDVVPKASPRTKRCLVKNITTRVA